ncbi:hypothetical protein BFN03_01915 [Rhodococcus sp. WMMA185]|uniref:hypothetical protein n=1 Tax=Rhodococcus sp. WMMA185 TaxID=679318 RepID=UPI0008791148|nr:hypothetical protein [Rhodococcus sp. WMMA185]AOW94281.1 hypothetical protein BFN03_01915 [Rhodococcus sp. WMMA185]
MPVQQLSNPQIHSSSLNTRPDRTLSVWDSRSECRFVVARAPAEPTLWDAYLEGAIVGYRKYGAEKALELSRIRDGSSTALFLVAIDAGESVAGGLRIHGPYRSADQAHAVTEWGTDPGAPAVRRMIEDRLPFGVIEAKGAWVSDSAPRRGELVAALARIGTFSMDLLDVQFMLATAATHVLTTWGSSGGVVAQHIAPVPYPDDRYQTRLMWWDRNRRRGRSEFMQLAQLLLTTSRSNPSSTADSGARSVGRQNRSVS